MTYFCRDCHEAFDEPSVKREWVGDREHGGRVEYMECPNCGSDDITDALLCPRCGGFCGELFGDGYKKIMCEECIKELATEENLIAYGYEDKQKIEINGYFAEMLPIDEIERLIGQCIEKRKGIDVLRRKDNRRRNNYIEENKDNLAIYFAEKAADK